MQNDRQHSYQPRIRQPQQSFPVGAGYLLIGILAIITFFICISSLYGQQVTIFLRGLEPSCIVGDGSATITVQSWSANDDCRKMAAGYDDFSGVKWGAILSPESEASGTIICERDLSGRHITIRDGNSLSNTGAVLCTMLDMPSAP